MIYTCILDGKYLFVLQTTQWFASAKWHMYSNLFFFLNVLGIRYTNQIQINLALSTILLDSQSSGNHQNCCHFFNELGMYTPLSPTFIWRNNNYDYNKIFDFLT